MSGLDDAAAAFQSEISGTPKGTAPEPGGAVEQMFSNMGQLEVDDESPAVAGGDEDIVDESVRRPEPKKAKKVVEESDDPEAELYEDDEDPKKAEEDDEEDDDDEEGGEYISEEEFEALRDRKVTIKIDGADAEVPLSEALDGYIRMETFHQRMNEVEEARGLLDTEAGEIQQARGKYIEMLDEAQALMEAVLPPEPNWDDLFAKEPARARAIQKSYGGMKAKIDEVKAKRAAAVSEGSEAYVKRMTQFKDMEARKFDASNPNWVGEEGAKRKQKDLNSMVRTARALGFKDPEINQIMDSRMLSVLLRASKYDRMMAARKNKTPLTRGKKLPISGAGSARTAPRGIDRAQKQLSRTGSVHDAANVFANIINRG